MNVDEFEVTLLVEKFVDDVRVAITKDAIASVGFDSRSKQTVEIEAKFGKAELFNAIKILEANHVEPKGGLHIGSYTSFVHPSNLTATGRIKRATNFKIEPTATPVKHIDDGLLARLDDHIARGIVMKSRKRRAKVLCVVPRCKQVGAPKYGMACRKHKDIGKAKIKSLRLARKAAKEKGK